LSRLGPRLVLFLTVFIHLVGFGLLLPLLPYYAETYGANGLAVGLLNTSFSLMQFFFSPIWGRLSDRIGRRPVILGSLIVTAVSYAVFGLSTSLPMLFASRILAGIAGAVIPTTQAYIADTTTRAERTKGMGLVGAAFGLGFIFGPAIGGILSRYGYSVPAFASAGLALVAAAFAFVMLPESLPPEKRGDAAARRMSAPSLAGALRRPAVRPVLLLYFLGTLCFAGLEGTFALFGEHLYGIGPRGIGYLLAYVGVIAAIMQAGLVGTLARRFGERALILSGFLILAVGMIYAGTRPVFGLLLVALGAIAVGNGMVAPSLAGLVSVASSAEEQGGILGVYQSLGSLARAGGPFLGGLAFDHLGHASPMWTGGIVIGLTSLIALELPARKASPAPRG
jgi:DHA1 family tetracycline resistance protein-like MFS transporter